MFGLEFYFKSLLTTIFLSLPLQKAMKQLELKSVKKTTVMCAKITIQKS